MFEITDAEKLRDAYTLLAFIRDRRSHHHRRTEVQSGRLYGQHQEGDPGLQQPPGT